MTAIVPVLLLGLSVAPTTLRRAPKVGDHATYTLRAVIELGGKDDVRFTGTVDERVAKIEAEVLSTQVETRLSIEALGIVRQGATLSSTRQERLEGTLLKATRFDPTLLFGVARVERLRAVFLPRKAVEVGEGWWLTEGSNADLKAPPFASYEKLEGEETVGERAVWRIAIDAHEVEDPNPIHVKGMAWIDKADGSLVRGQWTVSGFVYDATTPAMNARLELSRSAP